MKGKKQKLEDAKLDCDIAMTRFYAEGKPDAPGWRKLFAENKIEEIVERDGRIYPKWALDELERLKREHPEKF